MDALRAYMIYQESMGHARHLVMQHIRTDCAKFFPKQTITKYLKEMQAKEAEALAEDQRDFLIWVQNSLRNQRAAVRGV